MTSCLTNRGSGYPICAKFWHRVSTRQRKTGWGRRDVWVEIRVISTTQGRALHVWGGGNNFQTVLVYSQNFSWGDLTEHASTQKSHLSATGPPTWWFRSWHQIRGGPWILMHGDIAQKNLWERSSIWGHKSGQCISDFFWCLSAWYWPNDPLSWR